VNQAPSTSTSGARQKDVKFCERGVGLGDVHVAAVHDVGELVSVRPCRPSVAGEAKPHVPIRQVAQTGEEPAGSFEELAAHQHVGRAGWDVIEAPQVGGHLSSR
jgi:hypothetical protein